MSFVQDVPDEITTLAEVERSGDGWNFKFGNGWSFGGVSLAMTDLAKVQPQVGDEVWQWGSVGRPVRGIAINGVMLYYRSVEAQRRKEQAQSEERDAEKQRALDASRADRDARRAALPEPLRRRLSAFEANNPLWRRDFETYELSCCEDGFKIAAHLKSGPAIEAFRKMDWKDQQAAVPGLFDGHSGNSFSFAVRLAYWLATDPEKVTQEHGALCPLVGCKEYGHAALAESSSAHVGPR